MTDPTDSELLEFTARFAGFTRIGPTPQPDGTLWGEFEGRWVLVPDYLHSLDRWNSDVWPKVRNTSIAGQWGFCLDAVLGPQDAFPSDIHNADARSRCLALWRALDGRLPGERT